MSNNSSRHKIWNIIYFLPTIGIFMCFLQKRRLRNIICLIMHIEEDGKDSRAVACHETNDYALLPQAVWIYATNQSPALVGRALCRWLGCNGRLNKSPPPFVLKKTFCRKDAKCRIFFKKKEFDRFWTTKLLIILLLFSQHKKS